MYAYSQKDLNRLFGLSASSLQSLKREGFIPRSPGRKIVGYTFRDLIIFRMVGALRSSRVSPRSIRQVLRYLKIALSDSFPAVRVSLAVENDQILVTTGPAAWDAASGQYVLPLETDTMQSQILPMKKSKGAEQGIAQAHELYLKGADLEMNDVAAAKAAYEQCLAGDCTNLHARINLGRLLHLEGKHRQAAALYRDTEEHSAVLYFNLAIALEDLGETEQAIQQYRQAIVHDPGLADAHFNLALLLERAGESQAAFRHLLAYRRITDALSNRNGF